MHFNPRTPVGCDVGRGHVQGDKRISIHAPQWGATVSVRPHARRCLISIHAPQWGATHVHVYNTLCYPYFNPRTPVGCDVTTAALLFHHLEFQSTHPSGVRLYRFTIRSIATRFQSTHPSGVRQRMVEPNTTRQHFNPRTPVGCDWRPVYAEGICKISIHAPQWGATERLIVETSESMISIHAPQWGATVQMAWATPHRRYFNPRTPVGCD